jgi:hypothetical protein
MRVPSVSPGWIVLETSSPTKDPIADASRNGRYVRALLGAP